MQTASHIRSLRWLPMLAALFTVAGSALASLQNDVEAIVRRTDLGGATVGVCILEAGPGEPLVEINPDEPLMPASNMKLITTGAALHVLGADFRFRTQLVRDGGRLVVIGDGDPAFGDPELLAEMEAEGSFDVEALLGLWATAAAESIGDGGVSELVVDDRVFDREFVHPTWPRDQLNLRYCAEVAGLSFHLNVLHFYPECRAGERPGLDDYEPWANWLSIQNRGTCRRGPKDRNSGWFARKFETNELTFYGNVKHSYKVPVPVTVHEPPSFFGRLLQDRLRNAGVDVDRVRLAAPEDPDWRGAELAAPVIATPLTTVIARCNQDSQNLYAESLLKRVGFQRTGTAGGWSNGGAIVREVAHERLGHAGMASRLHVADGSGLSRDNRIAPSTLAAWLNSFHNDEKLGEAFVESLAVGGENGTLRRRFRDVDLHDAVVHAKSGYIRGVSCLSGYVTAPDGRRMAFSILINDLKAPVSKAKGLQDQIVGEIAEELAETRPATALGGE